MNACRRSTARNEVIQVLRGWDWEPVWVSMLPRITHAGTVMAGVYEIDIPKRQQAIIADRRIASSTRKAMQKSTA